MHSPAPPQSYHNHHNWMPNPNPYPKPKLNPKTIILYSCEDMFVLTAVERHTACTLKRDYPGRVVMPDGLGQIRTKKQKCLSVSAWLLLPLVGFGNMRPKSHSKAHIPTFPVWWHGINRQLNHPVKWLLHFKYSTRGWTVFKHHITNEGLFALEFSFFSRRGLIRCWRIHLIKQPRHSQN